VHGAKCDKVYDMIRALADCIYVVWLEIFTFNFFLFNMELHFRMVVQRAITWMCCTVQSSLHLYIRLLHTTQPLHWAHGLCLVLLDILSFSFADCFCFAAVPLFRAELTSTCNFGVICVAF